MSYFIAALGAALLSSSAFQAAPPSLHKYAVDAGTSRLYVVVHRAGLLSFLGHDHAVVPVAWTADLCLSDPIPAGAHGTLVLETGSLVIDSDSARALAGMGGGPGADDRQKIQASMLDADHLNATAFPEIRLELRAVEAAAANRVTIGGTIELHGVRRELLVPVKVDRSNGGRLILTGRLRIHQRDYGIEPESRAGVVKVSNDVDLHFALAASPTDAICAAAPPGP